MTDDRSRDTTPARAPVRHDARTSNDFNADGLADVALAYPSRVPAREIDQRLSVVERRDLLLLWGRRGGLSLDHAQRLEEFFEATGGLIAPLGDIDGNGATDLATCSYGERRARAGSRLHLGSPSGLATIATVITPYFAAAAQPLECARRLGDVTGDQIDDFAIVGTTDGAMSPSYAFYAGNRMMLGGEPFAIQPPRDGLPEALGDLDADGDDDQALLRVNRLGDDGYIGTLLALHSRGNERVAPLAVPLASVQYNGLGVPRPWYAGGDVNGDGVRDLVALNVGYEAGPTPRISRGLLVWWGARGAPLDPERRSVFEDVEYDDCRVLDFGVADVNGDGHADVFFNDGDCTPFGPRPGQRGHFFYALGSIDGFGPRHRVDVELPTRSDGAADDQRILRLSSPGDVDGDGFDDLVAETVGFRAMVFYGDAQGLRRRPDLVIELGSTNR